MQTPNSSEQIPEPNGEHSSEENAGFQCYELTCKTPAIGHLQINIPATGHEIGNHEPIKWTMGLKTCEEHCKSFNIQGMFDLNKPLVEYTENTCKREGKKAPDFNRAFTSIVPFNSMTVTMMKTK